MTGPLGNSEFFFSSNLNVSLDVVSGNIEISGNKIYCSPQSLGVKYPTRARRIIVK